MPWRYSYPGSMLDWSNALKVVTMQQLPLLCRYAPLEREMSIPQHCVLVYIQQHVALTIFSSLLSGKVTVGDNASHRVSVRLSSWKERRRSARGNPL